MQRREMNLFVAALLWLAVGDASVFKLFVQFRVTAGQGNLSTVDEEVTDSGACLKQIAVRNN